MNANYLVLVLIILIIIIGIIKKVNLYQSFLEGTLEGIQITINMFSYLLTFTFAISLLKSSGIIEDFISLINIKISPLIVVQSFIRPLSSSSSLSILIQIYEEEGVDSINGVLSTLIHSCVDASIYVIGFYIGVLELKKNDKLIKYGLILNITSVIVAILVTYIIFKIKC